MMKRISKNKRAQSSGMSMKTKILIGLVVMIIFGYFAFRIVQSVIGGTLRP